METSRGAAAAATWTFRGDEYRRGWDSSRPAHCRRYTQFKDILPTLGITVKFVDSNDPKAFAAAADDKTRAFFTETVSNPALDVADIEAIANEAHALGLPLIVDDTFTTPYLCQPFKYGADIICHSLTKCVFAVSLPPSRRRRGVPHADKSRRRVAATPRGATRGNSAEAGRRRRRGVRAGDSEGGTRRRRGSARSGRRPRVGRAGGRAATARPSAASSSTAANSPSTHRAL